VGGEVGVLDQGKCRDDGGMTRIRVLAGREGRDSTVEDGAVLPEDTRLRVLVEKATVEVPLEKAIVEVPLTDGEALVIAVVGQ
jgi:hypothetical protein